MLMIVNKNSSALGKNIADIVPKQLFLNKKW
jgi:hypothetical protein